MLAEHGLSCRAVPSPGRFLFLTAKFLPLILPLIFSPVFGPGSWLCFLGTDGGEWCTPSWHPLIRPGWEDSWPYFLGHYAEFRFRAWFCSVLCLYVSWFLFWGCPGFKRWVLGKDWWTLGDRTSAEWLGQGPERVGVVPFWSRRHHRACLLHCQPARLFFESSYIFENGFQTCFRTIVCSEVNHHGDSLAIQASR